VPRVLLADFKTELARLDAATVPLVAFRLPYNNRFAQTAVWVNSRIWRLCRVVLTARLVDSRPILAKRHVKNAPSAIFSLARGNLSVRTAFPVNILIWLVCRPVLIAMSASFNLVIMQRHAICVMLVGIRALLHILCVKLARLASILERQVEPNAKSVKQARLSHFLDKLCVKTVSLASLKPVRELMGVQNVWWARILAVLQYCLFVLLVLPVDFKIELVRLIAQNALLVAFNLILANRFALTAASVNSPILRAYLAASIVMSANFNLQLPPLRAICAALGSSKGLWDALFVKVAKLEGILQQQVDLNVRYAKREEASPLLHNLYASTVSTANLNPSPVSKIVSSVRLAHTRAKERPWFSVQAVLPVRINLLKARLFA